MFSALLYLQYQTVKNRLWERIRRLRRPRYLFGALAGGAYLVLVFGRPFFVSSQALGGLHHGQPLFPEVPAGVWEFVVACALLVLVTLAWLIPRERTALVFTEAEIAFLFPAPIRRQTLIHYKLLRSQLAVLFTVVFLTLFTRWSGGLAGALMRAAGYWILLSTINLHLLGASFVRTSLLEHGVTAWRRRGVIVVILLALGFVAVRWARGQVPALGEGDLQSPGTLAHYLNIVANSPPAHWLLLPFRVAVRPLRSDVAFEEASIAVSQRFAARAAAIRSGNWQNTRPARKRRAPFRLAPTGSPAVAILWKNLLGAGQFFNARLAFAAIAWAAIVGTTLGTSVGRGRPEWPLLVGMMCVLLLGMTLVFGAQFVRQDFRRDLLAADLLKIYPMSGWQLALGELLAPAVILTAIQWVLLVLATTLLGGFVVAREVSPVTLSHGIAVALLCPTFNLISLLIPNAAALLLPAWFVNDTTGSGVGSRGIEVIGQRLLFLAAQLLTLLVALVPAGVASFLVWVFASSHLSTATLLPLAAGAASAVFAGEAAGGLALLGHWFEQYDVSAEKT